MTLQSYPGVHRRLGMFVVAAAVLWHLVVVLAPPRVPPPKDTEGRDFASYYYAAKVAGEGGDPYDRELLGATAESEGTRAEVHPFFYPPPFLWLVPWWRWMDLRQSFAAWFVFNELCLVAACLTLERWWRPFSELTGPILAGLVALMYGVAYSAELGQANFPVLALLIAGLAVESRRSRLAGVLVGLAAMLKMSPALIVAWWALRGRWPAVRAAVATAIGSSLLTLPLLSLPHQVEFYRDVLPRFASGDYNGLTIQIDMFANHSVPNLLHQLFPSGQNMLSRAARVASTLFNLGVLGAGAWLFGRRTEDPVPLAAQACSVLVAMLLVPVYTYEHHLVFALPAMLFAVLAVGRGWLGSGWAVPVGLALAALLYDQPALRQLALKVVGPDAHPLAFLALQELKFLALCTIGAAMVRLGTTRWADPGAAPAPQPA